MKVELDEYAGSDESHALSAWTSTRRELDWERRNRLPQLLKSLAKDGHHTPFEKSYLHFVLEVDTATHIQILKHRIGVSVNVESARYKEHKRDKYYVPVDWPDYLKDEMDRYAREGFRRYHQVLEELVESGMDRKRAKESARYFLPYASVLTMDASFNFRSFMHFQKLRNHKDAQLEIRYLAQEMLEEVRSTGQFTFSLEAFGF